MFLCRGEVGREDPGCVGSGGVDGRRGNGSIRRGISKRDEGGVTCHQRGSPPGSCGALCDTYTSSPAMGIRRLFCALGSWVLFLPCLEHLIESPGPSCATESHGLEPNRHNNQGTSHGTPPSQKFILYLPTPIYTFTLHAPSRRRNPSPPTESTPRARTAQYYTPP